MNIEKTEIPEGAIDRVISFFSTKVEKLGIQGIQKKEILRKIITMSASISALVLALGTYGIVTSSNAMAEGTPEYKALLEKARAAQQRANQTPPNDLQRKEFLQKQANADQKAADDKLAEDQKRKKTKGKRGKLGLKDAIKAFPAVKFYMEGQEADQERFSTDGGITYVPQQPTPVAFNPNQSVTPYSNIG